MQTINSTISMDKFKKFEILKLFLMAILLSITPLLSTSLRPPYLYFIVNLLIIALGAEAGLLSFIFKASDDKKTTPSAATIEDSPNNEKSTNATPVSDPTTKKKPNKAVQKSSSEKIASVGKVHDKIMEKSPLAPSLFFIGGGETEGEENEFSSEEECYDQVVEAVGDDEELFHKAERFIGNFYKQLKMQREDSWKKIHRPYQKAF